MPTRPYSVVFDATDPDRLARFWADALGWEVAGGPDHEVVRPGAPEWADGGPPRLLFDPVDEPKRTKNRVHLDLASATEDEQRSAVARLVGLGAREADVGQGDDVPWVVLADPEGNEFCVLGPNERYRGALGIAAVVMDCTDPQALAGYWAAASGWPVVHHQPDFVAFGLPGSAATQLELLAVPDTKRAKNRPHVDLATSPGDDHAAEVARLEGAGARRADIGQGDVPWVVLADPEGNEHCLLDLD